MNLEELFKRSKTIASKQEACAFIPIFLNAAVTPTFGLYDEDYDSERPITDPYHVYKYDFKADDEGEEHEHACIDVYKKALKLVDILAKKWNIPFDQEMFEATMSGMRKNREGLWNSSSIGC